VYLGRSQRHILDTRKRAELANHNFAIVATVDLGASDAAGEPVIHTTSFGSAHLASM
jgi:hypothetical protein